MTIDIKTLPFSIHYVDVTTRDDWACDQCDQWCVRFDNGEIKWKTDYFTGMGHRKNGQPVTPELRDVLESLLLDASSADYDFDDWCADFGYSNDSIKAFDIYRECLTIADRLNECLGRDTVQQLREQLSED